MSTKAQQIRQFLNALPLPDYIVVIGQGGIGSILTQYLAILLQSLEFSGPLVLVDGDEYEPDNTYRMAISEFGNKAVVNAKHFEKFCPDILFAHCDSYVYDDSSELDEITEQHVHVEKVIPDGSVVFLAVDNHKTRQLVSEHCQTLKNVLLISAGNDGVDPENGEQGTYGNVQIYQRQGSHDVTAPLTKFHPEIRSPEDYTPAELDCLQMAATSAPQLLPANLMAASCMLNAFVRYLWGELLPDEVPFDVLLNKCSPVFISNTEDSDEK